LPLFIVELDFMSELAAPDDDVPDVLPLAPVLDFMSVDDEPAPVPDPVAGDVADVAPLLEGEVLLSVPGLVDPLPPLVAPAPDVDPLAAPLPEPLAPPAPPLWANADVASIAPATVSASALIHVFITVLLMLCVFAGAG
jgi:hypothetical protein